MTTGKEQLEAEIAQRDARIAELEAQAGEGTSSNKYRAELYDEVWQAARDMGYGNVTGALQELAALKAQPLSLAMEVETEGWWNESHDVYTWPIRIANWGARIECHGNTPTEAQQLALSVVHSQQPGACVIGGTGISSSMRGALAEAGQQPSAGVVDEQAAFEEWYRDYANSSRNVLKGDCMDAWQARARLSPATAGAGVVLPDLITELKKQAEEIAQKGHAGWGNTMLSAAEALSVAGVVVGALVSALEGIVHDERVPNEVSQDYAALLIEARRLNPCRAQAVPEGYVVVPVEPTQAMFEAGRTSASGSYAEKLSMAGYWRAMIAAAPSTKKEPSDE